MVGRSLAARQVCVPIMKQEMTVLSCVASSYVSVSVGVIGGLPTALHDGAGVCVCLIYDGALFCCGDSLVLCTLYGCAHLGRLE